MPTLTTISYEVDDGLAVVSLNRPEKRNAMNREMFVELADAAERAASDPDVRGLLLRAEGPSFSAGIDLMALSGLAGQLDRFDEFVALAQRPFRLMATIPVPVVAAVRGHSLGAGFQLALACDARVAATDASFGLLEARYGLIPDLGGLYHLTRLAGPSVAKELAWAARTVSARDADRLGLVNRLVEPERLDEAANAFARELIGNSPVTARLVKGLVARADDRLEAELMREARAQREALSSADHREAVAAFFEKRPPTFTGR
jgi:2-(1,2-epoxy-1,2-dihydrophenyl)acetyl-CoA isomerase